MELKIGNTYKHNKTQETYTLLAVSEMIKINQVWLKQRHVIYTNGSITFTRFEDSFRTNFSKGS